MADVLTDRPVYHFRGEAVPIFDPESEGNPPAQKDPEIEALFDESLIIQERKRRIKLKRKALASQPFEEEEEEEKD